MNTRLACAAAAICVLCAPLHAQTPLLTAPASPSAPAAPAVTLRYKFVVGQVHRYKYDAETNVLMATGQTGAGVPISTTIKAAMRQTVKSIRPADGAATIITQIESVRVLHNGQEVPVPKAQSVKVKQPLTLIILPTGKILFMGTPSMSAIGSPGMDFSKGMFSAFAMLPNGPVKAGDTWSGSGTASTVGAEITSKSALAALSPALATIQSKLTGTIDQTVTQGTPVPMKMEGHETGQTSQVFDISAGAIQSVKGTYSAKITMLFGKSANGATPANGSVPPGMPSAMKMQMQIKFMMQRLSDTRDVRTMRIFPSPQ